MVDDFAPRSFELTGGKVRFAPTHVRAPSHEAGFFSIGFAIAVLLAGAAVTGGVGALSGDGATSSAAPSTTGDRQVQLVDKQQAASGKQDAISKAPVRSLSESSGGTTALQ